MLPHNGRTRFRAAESEPKGRGIADGSDVSWGQGNWVDEEARCGMVGMPAALRGLGRVVTRGEDEVEAGDGGRLEVISN